MTRNRISTLFYFIIVESLLFTSTKAQVQLLWTSPITSGSYKGSLYEVGSSSIRYFYTVDTSTHECKLYNSTDFTLAYTIANLGDYDYPYYCLNDMNGNGHPEVFFYYPVPKIRDAKTGAVIYTWTASDVFQWIGTTPGSNIIKIAIRNSIPGNSSLSVYSLGITTNVTQHASIDNLPNAPALKQNYPNPFNPITTIEYTIPASDIVSVDLFNISGQLIKSLVNEREEAGEHRVKWGGLDNSGSLVASGTYFYVVKVGNSIKSRKMILLK